MTNEAYRIKSKSFILRWIVAGFGVWPLALAIAVPVTFILGFIMNIAEPYDANRAIRDIGMAAAFGSVAGFAVGILQKRLMQRQLFVDVERWRLVSVIGGALGALAVAMALEANTQLVPANCYWMEDCQANWQTYRALENLIPMTLLVTILSVMQWLELRNYVHHAWLWVLANFIGGLVFSLTVGSSGWDDSLLALGGAVLAQAGLTGGVMLWLFQMALREEILGENEHYHHPGSVWNQVV